MWHAVTCCSMLWHAVIQSHQPLNCQILPEVALYLHTWCQPKTLTRCQFPTGKPMWHTVAQVTGSESESLRVQALRSKDILTTLSKKIIVNHKPNQSAFRYFLGNQKPCRFTHCHYVIMCSPALLHCDSTAGCSGCITNAGVTSWHKRANLAMNLGQRDESLACCLWLKCYV